MAKVKHVAEVAELTIEEKLRALYKLQVINSEIDKIRTLRGELPLEVQDLEDEIAGLETRIEKLQEEIKSFESAINGKKNDMTNSKALIKNMKNNKIMYATTGNSIPYQKK